MLAQQGDLTDVLEHYRQALTIQQARAPGSLAEANTLGNIGIVLHKQDDLTGALEHYRQALTIQRARATGSLNVADTLHSMGNVLYD